MYHSFEEMEESNFFSELTRFLKKIENKDKTEFNYLEEKIQSLKNQKDEIEQLKDEKIIEICENVNPNLKTTFSETDFDLYIKQLVNYEKQKNTDKINSLNRKIDFYQIKINRLTNTTLLQEPEVVPEIDLGENEAFKHLNKIRNNDYSNYELTLLLKELSNNYEADLLESLLKDIEFYLFVEKDEKQSEFTSEDVENAVQRLKENNMEIPYYKRKPIEELTDKQKENRRKLEENPLLSTPNIDKEKLLFPFEFYDIYRFKNLINSKLKPQQKIENDLIPEIDLSKSNAVQKIIYLNELGIIDLLRKEPCFALSVNNLVNVITAITGEKHTTIQPYLNALLNKTEAENNNPYKTTSTVNKVKNQLVNLGLKPK